MRYNYRFNKWDLNFNEMKLNDFLYNILQLIINVYKKLKSYNSYKF